MINVLHLNLYRNMNSLHASERQNVHPLLTNPLLFLFLC